VTRQELLHRARLLSSARAQRFGKLPDDAGKWWQQIEQLAAEYDTPVTWDEWHSLTERREPQQGDL
jgi:nicotinamide mononucleotide adenylyltransferase